MLKGSFTRQVRFYRNADGSGGGTTPSGGAANTNPNNPAPNGNPAGGGSPGDNGQPSNNPVATQPQDTTALHVKIDALQNESAKYRVGRNQALRENHAMKAVLKAHNIPFDSGSADLGGLSIEDGKVAGEFNYQPAAKPDANVQPSPAGSGDVKVALTRDAISQMTPAQINSRWDEVQEVLKG